MEKLVFFKIKYVLFGGIGVKEVILLVMVRDFMIVWWDCCYGKLKFCKEDILIVYIFFIDGNMVVFDLNIFNW